MGKNIVVCCDGTALTYYHPGPGTMGAPGAWTRVSQWVSQLLGQAIGRGLKDDIRDAYVFLMHHYEPGDRVFFFGFSRGAYTPRVVAGMLHMFGLIRRGNEPLVPYAVRMLTKHTDDYAFRVAAAFKATFSRPCTIHFVGVWDTVNSVGWFWDPVRIPYAANNPDIAVGRHAIAIDERRAFFRTNLWRPQDAKGTRGPRDLKPVWFPGLHCDVGGGYPEAESGLSKVALEWMVGEAEAHGLLVDAGKRDEILRRFGPAGYTPLATRSIYLRSTAKSAGAEVIRGSEPGLKGAGRPTAIHSRALRGWTVRLRISGSLSRPGGLYEPDTLDVLDHSGCRYCSRNGWRCLEDT
jgi:uncharacterized protein (DUF2235 family)